MTIKMNQTIYEISKVYPEVVDIMVELGFSDIQRPGMLQTIGREITLEKGAKLRNIDVEVIQKAFKDKGFDLEV